MDSNVNTFNFTGFLPIGGMGRPLSEPRCSAAPYLKYRSSAGSFIDGQFEIRNEATSYLDLDTVYGRDENIAGLLREGEGGRMKSETYSGTLFKFVPFNVEDLPPSQNTTGLLSNTLFLEQPSDQIPTAGDRRIANNVALFLFHTLFLREHNRIALEISQAHPEMEDEIVFQKARHLNIAQYQNIVMNDHLKNYLGVHFDELVGQYEGYNEEIDPSTSVLFATVAYRFAHSALASYAPRDESNNISTLTLPPFLPPNSDVPNLGKFRDTIQFLQCY